MRRTLSTTARLELFLAAGGACQICGWRLLPGTRWEVDHILPLSLGGRDETSNLQVLCAPCHGTKTRTIDRPALAKAERLRARHLGARRTRHVIPGSRGSRWRKRLDGRVEPRRDQREGRIPARNTSRPHEEEP